MRTDARPLLPGIVLALAYLALLMATADPIGYAKDEGYYFSASASNCGWFTQAAKATLKGEPLSAFEQRVIDRHWENNHEHPSLAKILMGVTHTLTGWLLPAGLSYRLSSMLQAAGAVALIYLLALRWFGLGPALFASLAFIAMPRVFFHAHLNTFDMPNVFFWLLTMLMFWRGFEKPRYALAAGVMWGLAMSIRNSGVFIPVAVGLLYLRSPLMADFFCALRPRRIIGGLRAFGLWRSLTALLWTTQLLVAAWLQWGGSYRLTRWGVVALVAVSVAAPLALLTRGVLRAVLRDYQPLRRQWGDLLLLVLGLALAILASLHIERETPFNTLLLTIWLTLAGVTARAYLRQGDAIPAWARPVIAPAVLGPLTFFLVWPWLYHDTWNRVGEFLLRHLDPPAWQTIYLGKLITNPPPYPWSYPFVMWFFTIPAVMLFLLLLGAGLALWRGRADRRRLRRDMAVAGDIQNAVALWRKSSFARHWLLLVGLALPPLVIAMPSTPVYGGTKHYMHAMPFFVILCAMAARWLYDGLTGSVLPWLGETLRRKTATAVLLGGALLTPSIIGAAATHPYNLGYYNEFMGGTIAAPEIGMQQSFWAYQTRAILPWINAHTPPNGSLAFNNLPWDCFEMYKREGKLRSDIRMAIDRRQADFYLTNLWQMYYDDMYDVQRMYGGRGIVAADMLFGLPMVSVHQNLQLPGAQPLSTPWSKD